MAECLKHLSLASEAMSSSLVPRAVTRRLSNKLVSGHYAWELIETGYDASHITALCSINRHAFTLLE